MTVVRWFVEVTWSESLLTWLRDQLWSLPHSGSATRSWHKSLQVSSTISSGPVRYQGQHEAPVICVSLSIPSGYGGECFFPPLRKVGEYLHFPSCSSAEHGCPSPPSLPRQGHPSGPLLHSIGQVPRSPGEVSSTHTSSRLSLPVSNDQGRHSLPSESVEISASRVAFMRVGLAAKGFNKTTADMTLKAHRVSTSRQYQSVWSMFRAYVSSCGLSLSSVPSSALIGLVCNFLSYASTDLHHQYRTVTTYRSALRHPLLITCGVEIKSVFSDLLLRGIFNACPPQKAKPMPTWSLSHVLSFLDSPVFEPLETAEPISLLWKVLFLVFLATGRRKGKVSSLSRQFSKHWTYLRLICPWFFTQTPHSPIPVITSCTFLFS